MNEIIRILIADDHALLRGGLQAVIEAEPDMEIVGQACDGVEAVFLARELAPDITVMDLLMPNKDGIEAIHDIRRENPDARILVLTSFSDSDKMMMAVRAGAQGYVLKNSPPADFLAAIRDVYHGGIALQPTIARQINQTIEKFGELDSVPPEPLTGREEEILRLMARGMSNAAIAAELVISERTVGVHIGHILEKLYLENRTQAVLFALRNGIAGLFGN